MKAKPVLILIHRWVGLVLALLLLMQAVTGLLLVHKEALEPLATPAVRVAPGPKAGLDAVLASVNAARPDLTLDRIYTPQRTDRALTARMLDVKRRITILIIDPSSARVISTGPIQRYPLQLTERLHVALMQGAIGQVVLLIEGLGLLFMAISGLIVWWPRIRTLRQALTVHWNAGARRRWYDLHLVPGALASVFVAVSAFTGVGMIADPIFKAVVGVAAPVSPPLALPDMPKLAPGQSLASAQSAMDALWTRFPDARLRQIRFFAKERLVGVVMESGRSLNPRSHHLAAVDRAAAGKVIVWEDGDRPLAGDAVLGWMLPTHTGEIYGPARGVIMSLVGLTLLLLTVSGVWLWISKPRRR